MNWERIPEDPILKGKDPLLFGPFADYPTPIVQMPLEKSLEVRSGKPMGAKQSKVFTPIPAGPALWTIEN